MNKILKIVLEVLLAVACVFAIYAIYNSMTAPIKFRNEKEAREQVAIKRLQSLKILEESYKEKYHRFQADPDSIKMFFNEDFLYVETRFGTMDDSLTSVITTRERTAIEKDFARPNHPCNKNNLRKEIMKDNPKMQKSAADFLLLQRYEDEINIELEKRYEAVVAKNMPAIEKEFEAASPAVLEKIRKEIIGDDPEMDPATIDDAQIKERFVNDKLNKIADTHIAYVIKKETPVKDALMEKLLAEDPNFDIDSVMVIPFSGGELVKMRAEKVTVSSVPDTPVFEAKVPYKSLLKDLDQQELANLLDERANLNKYGGLMLGGIENPNNNEGNWK